MRADLLVNPAEQPASAARPRREMAALLVFSVLYFAVTGFLAHRKLLWTDELVTLYMAQLPTSDDLWRALTTGADTLPPLGHYLTRFSIQLLGDSHVAVRAPAVVGYWLMCVCIYWFTRAYVRPAYAWLAVLVPFSTAAFQYAYEARPYGLMLGFCASALLCWQRAAESGRGSLWRAGLAVSLAAAVAAHWYSTLLYVALGVGEVARLGRTRRADLRTWGAMMAGPACLLALLPIIRHARSFSPAMSSRSIVPPSAVLDAYQDLFGPSVLLLLALLAVVAWMGTAPPESAAAGAGHEPDAPVSPAARWCMTALVLTPLSGAALASVATGVYGSRYLVLTVIGLATGVGVAAGRLGKASPHFARAILVAGIVSAGAQVYQAKAALTERSAVAERKGLFAILGCAAVVEESLDPIVVVDVHSYFALRHYAPAALSRRLVYLTAYNAIASRMSLGLGGEWHVNEYRDFVERTPHFLVYDSELFSSQVESPLLASLAADGAAITGGGCANRADVYPRPGQLYSVRFLQGRFTPPGR